MKGKGNLKVGSVVQSTNGNVGSVDEIILDPKTGEVAYLLIQRGKDEEKIIVSGEVIKEITDKSVVKLAITHDQVIGQSKAASSELNSATKTNTEIRIPLVEERLIVGKREVDRGEFRLHKFVDEKEELFTEPVSHEDVEIKRIVCNEALDIPRETRTEGEWTIIPVMEEVLVVHRQLMLKEEIHIRKRSITEEQEIREVSRHERIEVVSDIIQPEVRNIPGKPGVTNKNKISEQRMDVKGDKIVH